MTCRLTTVIPVYNGGAHIIHALESVARQTRRPDRLVVLDDQSKDETREISSNFQPIRCEVIVNPKNLGLFGNHNRALELAAQTDFLHILHADDMVLPEFYERLLKAADQITGRALLFSSYEFVDEAGHSVSGKPRNGGPARELTLKEFLISQAELKAIGIDSALLKTDSSPAPCQFRLDLPQLGDCVFHAQWAAACGKILHVPDTLSQIRVRPDSATRKNARSVQSWSIDEWRAMELISALIKEGAFSRWLRHQKLSCLYAARTHVKIQQMRAQEPAFADELATAGKRLVRPHHWLLGKYTVMLRDAISSPKTQ